MDEDKKICHDFIHDGPPCLLLAKQMSFDVLQRCFTNPQVIEVSDKMLQLVVKLINSSCGGKAKISGTVHPKIFLAAYCIAYTPECVFENPSGRLEMKVRVSFLCLRVRNVCKKYD